MSDRIGFIGTGEIAAPMVRYLARKNHRITVSERSKDMSETLSSAFPNVSIAPNQSVIDQSDIVFLCLRPERWTSIVPDLDFREDQEIISVMARVSISDLAKACAPASQISITIPMAAMEHGECPLPVHPEQSSVAALFGDDNPVLPQAKEADIASHFAASAMLSAVLGTLHYGADWLALQSENPDLAETYVTALVRATLRDVPLGAGHLLAARDALATPGTLNEMMVKGLEDGDLPGTLSATLSEIKGAAT